MYGQKWLDEVYELMVNGLPQMEPGRQRPFADSNFSEEQRDESSAEKTRRHD
jgi:hypothetical protein